MNGSASTDFRPVIVPAAIVGVLGLAATAAGAWLAPSRFFPGYLAAFLFWVGIAQGSLALIMLHHLVGGGWGQPIRRPMEAAALTIPLMAILFVPIVLGLRWIYPWTDPSAIAEHQVRYLNPRDFTIRAAFYFAVWTLLAFTLARGSRRQDSRGDRRPTRFLESISGPGLVLFFFANTFAAVDWAMSREPDWFSTIYGVMWIVGEGVSAFAMMIVVASRLARSGDSAMAEAASPDRLHDLGNLLLAFVMLWAYMAFSQFLIIWSGNLKEEIPWYIRRTGGGWQWVALSLIVFHFIAPFLVLLSRESKRRTGSLLAIASLVVVMHTIDILWLVVPARTDAHAPFMDWGTLGAGLLAMAGVGGVWVSAFLAILRTAPLVPAPDPTDPHTSPLPGGAHGHA